MTQAMHGAEGAAAGHGRNPLGLIALVVGAVGILFNVLFTLVQAVAVGQGMYDLLSTFAVAHSILAIVIAVATIALGVLALLKKGAPKAAAGAGTALGAASLVSVLTGLLYSGVIAAASGF
ncbi:hypothetical protein [Subtercola boreus]|uniref:Uncharacterized protein n=1 Tax=Subtercola boreus TaxID=120213 RepID=A0A3E0WCA0_9MICO|nr:hypothetical protein [Subtercola boreus]RFA22374.1 hypothetical protein B7R24_04310 [Subtercola boreus]RFA22436.1 hypothetical protein B7R23_04305 [Subtercola boreus]RFA28451.1 hypothetical protein B7R25_04320 [Subtercola boreus]